MDSALVDPPATPHLAWLGRSRPRDKVLPEGVARAVLSRPVIVEEKADGALVGIDFPDGATARATWHGHVLGPGAHPRFGPLWGWLAEREDALARALGSERVLFGEWCSAVHAVRHDGLPDWFVVSDVFDRVSGRYWTVDRRNGLARQAGLAASPEAAFVRGPGGTVGPGAAARPTKVDVKQLQAALGATASELGTGRPAGFIVRLEQGDHLVERAQLVCAEVADAPDEPSTRKSLERNALRAG